MSALDPKNPESYTHNFDVAYSRFSRLYDFVVNHTSFYNFWLGPVLSRILGPRVLEISFGTGWLMRRYAGRLETYGIDLNWNMIQVTAGNLRRAGIRVPLQQAKVEALPYKDETFDTVVNTMAFSGYPRADDAMREIRRVLKVGGRVALVDVGWPEDQNPWGRIALRLIAASGDIVRDMGQVFARHGFSFSHETVGLYGSLHMWVAQKEAP